MTGRDVVGARSLAAVHVRTSAAASTAAANARARSFSPPGGGACGLIHEHRPERAARELNGDHAHKDDEQERARE